MKMRYIVSLLVLASATAGTPAWAQSPDNPLGTPAAAVGKFSRNYAEAVRMALPPIDSAELARVMERVRAATANEKPLAITNSAELEKFFSLRSRNPDKSGDFVDAGDAVYKFEPKAGRIYVAWRTTDVKPVARSTFTRRIKSIRAAHEGLAKRLGIPAEQVMFTDFREILTKTDPRAATPTAATAAGTPIMAEGGTTTLLRAVGGVLVEGSYLRVSSVDARRMSLVKATWPHVQLADGAGRALRAPKDMLDDVTKRIANDSRGVPVNVRMAIVLRPVDADKPGVYVPSLKIGVEPQAIKTADGYRTDAGQVYYSDLLQDSPPFVDASGGDSAGADQGTAPN